MTSSADLVSAAANAESAAAMVIAQPLNRNWLVAIRAITAWMNSRCFSLASIRSSPCNSLLLQKLLQVFPVPDVGDTGAGYSPVPRSLRVANDLEPRLPQVVGHGDFLLHARSLIGL